MLLVPSLCDNPPNDGSTTLPPEPDWGSSEEFLKEVNEYRAKFAKENRIPNMYKLAWSNELVEELNGSGKALFISSYRNPAESINEKIGKFKNLSEVNGNRYEPGTPVNLINPLQTFIGCTPDWFDFKKTWMLKCSMGFGYTFNFEHAQPGVAGSQCRPRFKGENGLCVPVDPSKHTFWGTKEEFMEDVNYMRRKYAKEFHIPNMHQLTWNESLVEVLKSLDLKIGSVGIFQVSSEYLSSSDSSWDGFGNNWRITELVSFSAAVVAIDEDVHSKSVLNRKIKGKEENIDTDEMIHPLQTSIGCMKKEREKNGEKYVLTACLLGNMGQWPTDFKLDANSKKIPGSECMDGYVNDDGLCVVAPSTTTSDPTEAHTSPKDRATEAVPAIPKKPDASDEKTKEGVSVEEDAELEPGQEALESSATTRSYSYSLLILAFTCVVSLN